MKQFEVTFAGFGGQGIMTAGQLLAYAGIEEGKQVAWIPSYGPEMRGGTAYCTVVISDDRIGSPIINSPQCICVFNRPSFDKFESKVKKNGFLLVNSSLIETKSQRTDITQLLMPCHELALKHGNPKASNLVMLGAFVAISKVVSPKTFEKIIKKKLGHKKNLLEINLTVFKDAFKYATAKMGAKVKV
ncbi:MAG: 2-oxoacid:ferredoxin oxidoreductase subunit gamma [Candidatus Zixiibacteriota bacterium]|nr:MAG: 2-oxoacid:ferredoxin oxidoreductase subunit gamma [candidate division Zixibacteria bacterium]